MKTILMHLGNLAPVWVAPLASEQAEDAARMIVARERRLPAGYHDTEPLPAWFSVVNTAIAWDGIALGMTVGDGALSGAVVATRDPADSSRMILQACVSQFDVPTTEPLLLDRAREAAAARGMSLVRRVERVDYVPV